MFFDLSWMSPWFSLLGFVILGLTGVITVLHQVKDSKSTPGWIFLPVLLAGVYVIGLKFLWLFEVRVEAYLLSSVLAVVVYYMGVGICADGLKEIGNPLRIIGLIGLSGFFLREYSEVIFLCTVFIFIGILLYHTHITKKLGEIK